jgi:hypothetical protein
MIEVPFFSLLSQVWWLFALIILIGIFNFFLPKIKGKIGEAIVRIHVKSDLNEPHYILMNDLTLNDGQGGTTQIDHVLLSPFGIFVIETKNYKGWIFGSEKQKQWTQKIYKNSYKFQNPIHQNYKHIKVLQSLLAEIVAPEVFHSIVVFMPEAEFKTEIPKQVFVGRKWTDYVKSFDQECISPMKLKRLQLHLEKEKLAPSWQTNREHVAQLKQRHQQKSPD